MAVNRCMCRGTSFAQVKRCAEETGATYEEVLELTGCGEGCGLCLPYIKLVLLSGLVDLPVLTPEVYKKLIAQYTEQSRAAQAQTASERTETPAGVPAQTPNHAHVPAHVQAHAQAPVQAQSRR